MSESLLQALKWILSLPRNKAKVTPYIFTVYKVSACALAISSSLLITKEMLGDKIHCSMFSIPSASKNLPYVNSYCLAVGTSTSNFTTHEISPGISYQSDAQSRLHSYYQWAPIVLMFQGLFFSWAPAIWKFCEGGRVQDLLANKRKQQGKAQEMDLNIAENGETVPSPMATANLNERLGQYVASRFGRFNLLGTKFLLLEFSAAACLGFHVIFVEAILDVDFLEFGWALWASINSLPNNGQSLDWIFPRQTTCSVNLFAHSGNPINVEVNCVIPFNIFIEKIYAFVWCWISLVILLAAGHFFILTLPTASFSCVRKSHFNRLAPDCPEDIINVLVDSATLSDYLVVYLILANINEEDRPNVIQGMANQLKRIKRQKTQKVLDGS